jgi:heme/copper-type cytochrome/quinol oxidase subunit 2
MRVKSGRSRVVAPLLSITMVTVSVIASGCGGNNECAFIQNTPVTIEVTGSEYKWHVLNPGRDGTLKTQDDILSIHQLHVPVNIPIHLVLHSEDYLYTFSVPEHDLKEIAVPEMTFTLDFELTSTGNYELRCDQLCGVIRPMVLGNLVAMSQKDYLAWLDGRLDGS